MFQENSIETCILSRVERITSPGWMHETSAWTWCNGKTQRERVEREVGGGIGMGNTCKPMAVSFQCMTKSTTNKKKNNKKTRFINLKKKFRNKFFSSSLLPSHHCPHSPVQKTFLSIPRFHLCFPEDFQKEQVTNERPRRGMSFSATPLKEELAFTPSWFLGYYSDSSRVTDSTGFLSFQKIVFLCKLKPRTPAHQ